MSDNDQSDYSENEHSDREAEDSEQEEVERKKPSAKQLKAKQLAKERDERRYTLFGSDPDKVFSERDLCALFEEANAASDDKKYQHIEKIKDYINTFFIRCDSGKRMLQFEPADKGTSWKMTPHKFDEVVKYNIGKAWARIKKRNPKTRKNVIMFDLGKWARNYWLDMAEAVCDPSLPLISKSEKGRLKVNFFAHFNYKYDPSKNTKYGIEGANALFTHMKNVLCSGDERQYQYMRAFMVSTLNHERTKIIMYLKSIQGTGKSIIWDDLLKGITGPASAKVGPKAFKEGAENAALLGKVAAIVDEPPREGISNWGDFMNDLKPFTTQDEFQLKVLYENKRSVDNFLNIFILTNNNALRITPDDRRVFAPDINPYWALKKKEETESGVEGEAHKYFKKMGDYATHPEVQQAFFNICVEEFQARKQKYNFTCIPKTNSKTSMETKSLDPMIKFISEYFIKSNRLEEEYKKIPTHGSNQGKATYRINFNEFLNHFDKYMYSQGDKNVEKANNKTDRHLKLKENYGFEFDRKTNNTLHMNLLGRKELYLFYKKKNFFSESDNILACICGEEKDDEIQCDLKTKCDKECLPCFLRGQGVKIEGETAQETTKAHRSSTPQKPPPIPPRPAKPQQPNRDPPCCVSMKTLSKCPSHQKKEATEAKATDTKATEAKATEAKATEAKATEAKATEAKANRQKILAAERRKKKLEKERELDAQKEFENAAPSEREKLLKIEELEKLVKQMKEEQQAKKALENATPPTQPKVSKKEQLKKKIQEIQEKGHVETSDEEVQDSDSDEEKATPETECEKDAEYRKLFDD